MKDANFSSLFILCIALALLSVAQTSGSAQNQKGAGVVPACDVEAYVDPTGSNGVNVRSGPGKTYKVIGNLPNQKAEGIEVHITGASGDWMRIDKPSKKPAILWIGRSFMAKAGLTRACWASAEWP